MLLSERRFFEGTENAVPPKTVLQFVADDLAADGLGKLLAEFHNAGIFVRCGMELYVLLNLFLQLLGTLGAGDQYDAGLDHLATDLVGSGADTALQNVRQFHNGRFDLKASMVAFSMSAET